MSKLSLAALATLFGVLLTLAVALLVGWVIFLVRDYESTQALGEDATGFQWPLMITGCVFFVAIIVGLVWLYNGLANAIRTHAQERDFLAMVTHELKTPLAGIRAAAQTIQRNAETADAADPDLRRRFLKGIVREVDRLTGLVNNILNAVQVEQQRGEVYEFCNLDRLIADRVEFARPRFETAGGKISMRPSQGGAIVRVRQTQLRCVIDNLVDNVLKYTDGPPELLVSSEVFGKRVILEFKDKGIGLKRSDDGKIFQRFARGEGSDTNDGLGLGLYLVLRIVQLHHGTVRATSPGPGKGTTFTIQLPLASPSAQKRHADHGLALREHRAAQAAQASEGEAVVADGMAVMRAIASKPRLPAVSSASSEVLSVLAGTGAGDSDAEMRAASDAVADAEELVSAESDPNVRPGSESRAGRTRRIEAAERDDRAVSAASMPAPRERKES